MEENSNMTAERSLEIIRESIEQSRRAMARNAGTPMIEWGVLTAVTALLVGVLVRQTGSPWWYFAWFPTMFLGFAVIGYLERRRPSRPRSIIGDMVGYVWISFAILAMSVPLVMFALSRYLWWDLSHSHTAEEITRYHFVHFPITTVIIIMLGLCTTITGFVLKSAWIKTGGIVSALVGAVLATLFSWQHMTVMAVVAVIGLVVPGIIINMKYRKA